ncbi:Uncharacterised protein [Buttiauxella agrestis]|uniref:Uncharacterized protein n=2 Tax=Buttiauxella agrestis TaxID=82977 RepID=A0A381C4F2_9ENTR|nr:Uncharacterised protein [Buttiauxella agrestis]
MDEAMNYQVTSLYFYSFKSLLWATLCCGLNFFGCQAPFLYLMVIGIVFPVLISIRLNTLTEQGAVRSNRETHDWLVFVRGIPVQEKRRHLSNPFFYSAQRATQFFLKGFLLRAALQASIIGWTIFRWPPAQEWWVYAAVLVALLVMLYSLWHTLCNLYALYKDNWEVESFTSPTESQWFRAFFSWGKNRQGALENLLTQF